MSNLLDQLRGNTCSVGGGHISLFTVSLEGGGAERVLVTVANALAEKGHTVDLVLVTAEGDYVNLVHDDVRVFDLNSSRILASLPRLVRYLKNRSPDTLLSTLFFANIISIWACQWVDNAPRLVLREANTISAKSAHASDPKFRLMPYLARWFYPWADRIVAVSKDAAKDLVDVTGVPEEKIRTIYNPVVTDNLRRQARESVSHSWFQDDTRDNQPPIILGAGRLERQKDFETLLRAFARVHRERPVRLVILGRGSHRANLTELASALGVEEDVLLPGFVDNPFKYMARASVFVLSSRFEGLPGVLIQAMATGCPVVSTDCPSGPREILQEGRYGPLVSVGDDQSLAQEILAVLDNPPTSSRMQKGADRFSEERAVEQYISELA